VVKDETLQSLRQRAAHRSRPGSSALAVAPALVLDFPTRLATLRRR
jgi:hypothetical protein